MFSGIGVGDARHVPRCVCDRGLVLASSRVLPTHPVRGGITGELLGIPRGFLGITRELLVYPSSLVLFSSKLLVLMELCLIILHKII